jgi:hypothetical protein
MTQSNRILEQALDRLSRLEGAPINVSDPRVVLPPKSRAMSDMEAMIFHFKQVMEGVKPPAGEVYMGIENPKGELGYYMVSDGTSKPVRWRIRPPSFINLASLPTMCEGALLADVIAINASVDIVMGEVDRGAERGSGAAGGRWGSTTQEPRTGRPRGGTALRPRRTSGFSEARQWPDSRSCSPSIPPSRLACCPPCGWCRKLEAGSQNRP